ncbi:hypothetical protein HN419_05550 [Candidatus Woesearchaeota archaeon]|nr:hypothetical protein [Candidatus Woesearchaeota archaeon]MBT7105335.1 hypothetical protein [Candidatus Woesearchaeota archaeon]
MAKILNNNSFEKGEDFFNNTSYLEPRCPGCGIKVIYDVSTEWSDKHEGHVCKECKVPVD